MMKTCREIADLLMQTPDAVLLLKDDGVWRTVAGVTPTGEHRNAVTFQMDHATAADEIATE